jgi:hypothetical protein
MSDLAIPDQLRLTIPARKAEARRLTQSGVSQLVKYIFINKLMI